MSFTLGLVATKITAETLLKAAIDKAALYMVNKSLAVSENEAASLAGRLVNAAAMKTDDFTSVPTKMQGFQNKALTPGIQSEIKDFAEKLTKINPSLSAKQATAIAHYSAMVMLQEAAAHSGNEAASTATFAVLHSLNESFKLDASTENSSFSPKLLEKRNVLSDRCEKLMTPSVDNKGLNNLSFGNRFTDRIVKPIINTPAFMVAGSKLIQQLTHKFSQFVDQNFTIKNIWPFEKDKTISVGGGLDHTERLIQDASRVCFDTRQEVKDFFDAQKGINRIVLFYGGYRPDANYSRYYEDLRKQYEVARKYAAPENIYILYADGLNPSKDQLAGLESGHPELIDSDMSFFRESPVLAATPENYWTIMQDIKRMSSVDDHLLVYSFDHGAEDGSICAWGEKIKPKDFATPIQSCKGKKAVLMHQCYAGGLAQAFDKTDKDLAVYAGSSPTQPTTLDFGPKAQLSALDYHKSFSVKAQDFFKTITDKFAVYKYQGATETPEFFGGNFRILATPQSQIGVKPLPPDYGPTISVYA